MTTQKHQREEDIVDVDVAEPPRKKSKRLKAANGESAKKDKKEKKDKDRKGKKEKKERISEHVVDGDDKDVTEAKEENTRPKFSQAGEAVESEKRKSKSKKEKKSKKSEKESTSLQGNPEENVTEKEQDTRARQDKKSKKEKKYKKEKKEVAVPVTISNDGACYIETAALVAVPESEITAFLSSESISVTNPAGQVARRPITSFSHLPQTTLLAKSPFAAFDKPTPIQAASWPYGLAGRDMIGIAETGSGKTMAFALPCVEAVLRAEAQADNGKDNRWESTVTRAVVVSPTRELAMQTHEQVSKLCTLVGLRCVCVYGGTPKDEQRATLRRGAHIVVATPGRLKDFLSDSTVILREAAFVVLDEADRMLDKGFEEDIKEILSSCPSREARQTLMFTATWPLSVQSLAATFMVKPVKITIGRGNGADASESAEVKLQANERIRQEVEVIDPRSKEQRVLQLVKSHQAGDRRNDRILVFCLYKKEAVRVERFLDQRGVRVCSIHGDLKQNQRTESLEAFKLGKTPVLVATDVAARGLDIPEVKLVLNVTFPLTIEDYVHRIGRTGRAGKEGHAITLFTEHDKPHSGELINVLKAAKQPVPDELLKFGTTVKKKGHDSYGAFYKNVDMTKKATKITFD